MAQSTLSNINPGNIVVPLSEIIDKLQGKLSTADINALLLSVTSKQAKEIRPGDLVTADFINGLINDIKDIDRRLQLLEVGKPSIVTAILIDEPTPTTVLRIGDPLIIRGEGLLADSLIMIGNTPLAGAFGSPDDTTLTIKSIPPLDIPGGLPPSGKTVILSVSNEQFGGATTNFILKPFVQTKPIGSMVIAQSDGPAVGTKYAKNGVYTFKFRITADTKPDIRFLVIANITGQPTWKTTLSQSVLFVPAAQSAGTPTIAEVSVTVEISGTAIKGDIGNLYITLKAETDSSFVWRSTPDVDIEVDNSATQVPKLNIALSESTAGDAGIRTNADNSLTALIGNPDGSGGTGELQFTITRVDGVSFKAGDYQIDLTKLASLPAGWNASVSGAASGKVNLSGSAQSVKISLTAQAAAGAAKLQLALTSVSDASVSGLGEFDIDRWHP
jgi:hypothetical protein